MRCSLNRISGSKSSTVTVRVPDEDDVRVRVAVPPEMSALGDAVVAEASNGSRSGATSGPAGAPPAPDPAPDPAGGGRVTGAAACDEAPGCWLSLQIGQLALRSSHFVMHGLW